jgi:hypothetical protein
MLFVIRDIECLSDCNRHVDWRNMCPVLSPDIAQWRKIAAEQGTTKKGHYRRYVGRTCGTVHPHTPRAANVPRFGWHSAKQQEEARKRPVGSPQEQTARAACYRTWTGWKGGCECDTTCCAKSGPGYDQRPRRAFDFFLC